MKIKIGENMNKKTIFLLKHKKIAKVYYSFKFLIYRILRIGKSECLLCKGCKYEGCIKNKILDKFKIACLFSGNCFESKWESRYGEEPIEKEDNK